MANSCKVAFDRRILILIILLLVLSTIPSVEITICILLYLLYKIIVFFVIVCTIVTWVSMSPEPGSRTLTDTIHCPNLGTEVQWTVRYILETEPLSVAWFFTRKRQLLGAATVERLQWNRHNESTTTPLLGRDYANLQLPEKRNPFLVIILVVLFFLTKTSLLVHRINVVLAWVVNDPLFMPKPS